jgi:hypothetical protein
MHLFSAISSRFKLPNCSLKLYATKQQLIYLQQWSENSLLCFSAGRYRQYGQQQTKITRHSFVIRKKEFNACGR